MSFSTLMYLWNQFQKHWCQQWKQERDNIRCDSGKRNGHLFISQTTLWVPWRAQWRRTQSDTEDQFRVASVMSGDERNEPRRCSGKLDRKGWVGKAAPAEASWWTGCRRRSGGGIHASRPSDLRTRTGKGLRRSAENLDASRGNLG